MTSIDKITYKFWSAVVRSTATNVFSLAIFRILTGTFLLLVLTINYAWMADLPLALFTPPVLSPINLFATGFPHKAWLLIADFTLLLTPIAIILGIKPRMATLLFALTRLLVLNYQYAFGKIDHEILLATMLVCLAFSGWGQRLAIWPDKASRFDSTTKSLALLAVLICFGYFSAAFEKAIFWLNFDMNTTGSARWFYNSLYNYQREPLLAPLLKMSPFWVFKAMDITGVIFELLPFAALLYSRKLWQSWLLLAAGFHLVNLLFFNINFIVNGIVYLAFIDYTTIYATVRRLIATPWFKAAVAGIIIYAAYVRVVSILTFEKIGIVFLPYSVNMQLYGMVSLWLLICTTMLIGILYSKEETTLSRADILSQQIHKSNLIDHQTTI
ncbi:hypothetical protein LT679_15775 [Mucilaginibacter roseus]|uniref:HTTM domain-containing protein n=1 Tax=Mucilaginibacter roseus TaxID=1528868 RepID=A0ABS8U8S8_9SPHI|nr:hypothetical protein [Mucilaginibacter roseus]MCD8742073.1 hypothetical protein [Mucilaginibacter roseus]